MTNKEKMIRILCDVLDGCPLTYPCDKLWSPEGWCKDHCKAGQQEPDAECWLKYAEVMTSETLQAQDVPDINVGDMISRQVAIDALCRRCDLAVEDDEPCTEKCNDIKILEKLPPVQPENADCIYCHEDSDGYVKPIEKNCHAFIRFGMDGWEISLSAKGWNGSAKIMYCPMCGRKFKK